MRVMIRYNLVEADETLTAQLALAAPLTGGRLSATSDTGSGTIENDDTATYTIDNATVRSEERRVGKVGRSKWGGGQTRMKARFTDGTRAGRDFNHTLVQLTSVYGKNK